eukprot:1576676-Rhodomonas_salina.1
MHTHIPPLIDPPTHQFIDRHPSIPEAKHAMLLQSATNKESKDTDTSSCMANPTTPRIPSRHRQPRITGLCARSQKRSSTVRKNHRCLRTFPTPDVSLLSTTLPSAPRLGSTNVRPPPPE